MTDLNADELQARIEKFGLTEEEARISMYLDEAERLFTELERQDQPQQRSLGHLIWRETHVREQFNALRRHLALRVLRRDYPHGWGYRRPADDEEDDEG